MSENIKGDVKIKDGKVAKSDREKYRAMAVETGDILTVPPVLMEIFKENGLASKWVSKKKIENHGGYHPTGWIPYEITPEVQARLPRSALGNVVGGHLVRGDILLAVKPKELQDAHRKELRRKTKHQLESHYQEKDAAGRPLLERPE